LKVVELGIEGLRDFSPARQRLFQVWQAQSQIPQSLNCLRNNIASETGGDIATIFRNRIFGDTAFLENKLPFSKHNVCRRISQIIIDADEFGSLQDDMCKCAQHSY